MLSPETLALLMQGLTHVTPQSVVMILVFAVIVVTFLVDLAYAVVDPRLRRH